MSERYFLDSDDDGHWYIVPVSQLESWWEWVRQVNDDPYTPRTVPYGVRPVNGSYTQVTFTEPAVDDEF